MAYCPFLSFMKLLSIQISQRTIMMTGMTSGTFSADTTTTSSSITESDPPGQPMQSATKLQTTTSGQESTTGTHTATTDYNGTIDPTNVDTISYEPDFTWIECIRGSCQIWDPYNQRCGLRVSDLVYNSQVAEAMAVVNQFNLIMGSIADLDVDLMEIKDFLNVPHDILLTNSAYKGRLAGLYFNYDNTYYYYTDGQRWARLSLAQNGDRVIDPNGVIYQYDATNNTWNTSSLLPHEKLPLLALFKRVVGRASRTYDIYDAQRKVFERRGSILDYLRYNHQSDVMVPGVEMTPVTLIMEFQNNQDIDKKIIPNTSGSVYGKHWITDPDDDNVPTILKQFNQQLYSDPTWTEPDVKLTWQQYLDIDDYYD